MALSNEQKTVLKDVMLQRTKILVDAEQAIYDAVDALTTSSEDSLFGAQVTAYNAVRIKALSDIADIIRELP